VNAPLAEFTDYESLRQALMAVRELRDVSFERLDEITGAAKGYFSKVLGPGKARHIGRESLGWALGGLGVKCILVSDPDALARVQRRFEARDKSHLKSQRSGTTLIMLSRRHMAIIQAKGRKSRWDGMTSKQKSKWGKRMAKARIQKMKQRARQRKAAHKARKAGCA
jgi:hypothetical protein